MFGERPARAAVGMQMPENRRADGACATIDNIFYLTPFLSTDILLLQTWMAYVLLTINISRI